MTTLPDPRDRVRAKKMADIVADRIRRQIAAGELTEGDWLPTEVELMQRFAVSRPTLREAFRLLEADSLVQVRRGPPGGARVHRPGPEAAAPILELLLTLSGTTVLDVYEALAVVEPVAVRRLAERGTDVDHDLLERALDQLAEAMTAPYSQSLHAFVRFHRLIVELAGNQTLALMTALLGEVLSRHLSTVYAEQRLSAGETAARNRRVLKAYRSLIELVRSRDGAAAEKFWAEHLSEASSYLLRDVRAARRQVIDLSD